MIGCGPNLEEQMTVIRIARAKAALVGVLGAFILAASPAALLAQPAPTVPAAAMPGQPVQLAKAKGAHAPRSALEHVDGQIATLHRKLGITAEQEPQFKAYADVMRGNAEAMDALFKERAQSTGPNPADAADSRLHWYARLTAAHAEGVGRLVPVFDALYQSLSDQQKKTADAVFQRNLQQRRTPHRGHRTQHTG
jgi:periplasmic protein CpxP/Spy